MSYSKVLMLKSNAVPNVALPVLTAGPPSQQLHLLPETPLHFEVSVQIMFIITIVRYVNVSNMNVSDMTEAKCLVMLTVESKSIYAVVDRLVVM